MTILLALVSLALPLLLAWFYPHSVRPALALAGARYWVFVVVLVASVVTGVSAVVFAVGLLIGLPRDVVQWAGRLLLLGLVPAIAYLAPQVVVRISGGPDQSVPVRYLLAWFARRWSPIRQGPAEGEQRRRTVRSLWAGLDQLDDDADKELADRWRALAGDYLTAAEAGSRDPTRIDTELRAVRWVDPLGPRFT